jgi:hypothetical protein
LTIPKLQQPGEGDRQAGGARGVPGLASRERGAPPDACVAGEIRPIAQRGRREVEQLEAILRTLSGTLNKSREFLDGLLRIRD